MQLHPSYLSGLFDGEGYISLCYLNKRKRQSDSEIPIRGLRLIVGIALTHESVLRKIRSEYGGHLGNAIQRTQNHKPIWRWTLCGKDSQLFFLTTIKPFAIIKGRTIDLAIQYLSTVGKSGHRISQTVWDNRLEIYEVMRKLNQRGPDKPNINKPRIIASRGHRPKEAFSPAELKARMDLVRSYRLTKSQKQLNTC